MTAPASTFMVICVGITLVLFGLGYAARRIADAIRKLKSSENP